MLKCFSVFFFVFVFVFVFLFWCFCHKPLACHTHTNHAGEDFTSCYNRSYAPKGMEDYGVGGSGIVPTAWALLGLMTAKCSDTKAVERGIHFLLSQQRDDGDFPQQGISGVFNRACGITYTAYRNVREWSACVWAQQGVDSVARKLVLGVWLEMELRKYGVPRYFKSV